MTARDHNKLLGIFFLVNGGLSAFGGVLFALMYGGIGTMLLTSAKEQEAQAVGGIFMVIGVLVDASPPFEGRLIPSIGFPLDFIHIEMTVSPEASGDLEFRFVAASTGTVVDPLCHERCLSKFPAGALQKSALRLEERRGVGENRELQPHPPQL